MAANELDQREVLDFVDDLIQATEAGSLQWRSLDDTGARETFLLSAPGGIVSVESLGEQEHPFVLRIYDDSERKLYEMRTEVAPFYNASEARIGELFFAARNAVFDVSGTIRRMRSSLGLK